MKLNELLPALVQVGLTVSAVAVLLFALRKALKKRYPARAMCVVWAVLALRLLVPVQLTLPDAPVQVTPRTTYLSRTDFAPDQLEQAGLPVLELDGEITTRRWVTGEQAAALGQSGAVQVPSWDVGKLLGILWGAGALVFALWQLYGYLSFHYVLTHSSHPAERDTLLVVLDEQKRALGIRRAIPLRVTPAADCPMLAGFVRPALYLPDEALSEQDAAFIFRHELMHYKRGDLWLKLALVAARAVHWFNPLVHLLARFAQEDIELACDDAVVRGMDAAARRAYGETILRSVEAQVRHRALVSCFTGDKEGLMRRFEGLFDKNVKKRGVALVVAAAVLVGTLGCAVSVGESNSKPDEATRRVLAEQWAQRTENLGYTVKLDGEDTYVLYDVQFDNLPDAVVPYRTGEKLVFEQGADGWQVVKAEPVAPDGVTTLEEFRLLYENDLGLPDPIAAGDMALTEEQQQKWSDPVDAATELLHLQIGGIIRRPSSDETLGDDIVDLLIEFPDHSEVTITMVSQFDAGWLPQDYTYDGGKNARTAADLAGQYARGVTHKSGQFVYPILTAQKQEEFRIDRPLPDGGFNWKYGGSSPSYRGYTLVPVDDEGSYRAVFQMYGGGATDMRSAFLVSTAQADGRRVIDRVTEVAESNYTKSDLFKLYYDSGLPWPTIPEGANHFNGVSLDTLTRVRDAVETVFGYFGENIEHIEGNMHQITLESWFKSEVVSEDGDEAVVRLNFVDNSPSVDVQMRKTDGYWLPVGLAEETEDQPAANTGDAAIPDYTITSTAYHNGTYGYTLTLPDCFVGQGYAKENDDVVKFGLQNALPGYTDDPTDGGTVMGLYVQATASLKAQFGEDWQAGHPVPCKELTERDGLTYYLAFASDVQYDPSDEEITAAYTEMSAAAYAMGADAISFDGQNEAQAGRARQQVLHDLAVRYAYAQNEWDGAPFIDEITVEPNLTDGSCALIVRYLGRSRAYYFTTTQRLWYEKTDTITPARTEDLVNTSDGVRSLGDFWYAFPLEQGFPVFDTTGLEKLSDMAAKPASLENPDLSTPEACAEYVLHFVTGEWVGRTGSEDDGEMRLTYRWDDGDMTIRVQRVQLSDSSPALWLPVGYDGWQPQYPPYLSVVARMMDYYPYRSTGELLQALDMGWVDGAYAEGVFAELDQRWQQDADAVESAVAGFGTTARELWASHKAANPDIFGARFSDEEIEAACQAVRDYAETHGFSVENLWYDADRDIRTSQDIMKGGVLQDNVQNDGLTVGDVITVIGDAHFGEGAWRDKAEGYSFTLYRGADGKWVLEDGAYGY
nr:M56 family metallopeptidase [uncultured Agathobaculum sp.]